MPSAENAGEGQRHRRARPGRRAAVVINQPLGPVPGPGDIAPRRQPAGGRPRRASTEGYHLFVQLQLLGLPRRARRRRDGPQPARSRSGSTARTPDRIFNSIAQGRGRGMPSWGARIPEKQLWELTAYVQLAAHARRARGAAVNSAARRCLAPRRRPPRRSWPSWALASAGRLRLAAARWRW